MTVEAQQFKIDLETRERVERYAVAYLYLVPLPWKQRDLDEIFAERGFLNNRVTNKLWCRDLGAWLLWQ